MSKGHLAGRLLHWISALLFMLTNLSSQSHNYAVLPNVHSLHRVVKKALWWLIGIRFAGILIGKK